MSYVNYISATTNYSGQLSINFPQNKVTIAIENPEDNWKTYFVSLLDQLISSMQQNSSTLVQTPDNSFSIEFTAKDVFRSGKLEVKTGYPGTSIFIEILIVNIPVAIYELEQLRELIV